MKYLILILMLVGCGQPEGQNTGTSLDDQGRSVTSSSTDKNVAPTKEVTAKVVMALTDLAPCDATNDANIGDLVYVKENGQFYYCDEKEGWTTIDLKGKDGVAGKDGINGKNGSEAAAAKPVGDNEWLSPITGQRWFLGTYGTAVALAKKEVVCPTGSRLPISEDEITEAIDTGLFTKLGHYFDDESSHYVAWQFTGYTDENNLPRYKMKAIQIDDLSYSEQFSDVFAPYSALLSEKRTYAICVATN